MTGDAPAKDNGATDRLPPAILFSAHRPSGRSLAASLLAIGLAGKEHNAVLADWGFDQSPLIRYFDAEHLAVVYSKPAQEGIFVTPRLALFSSSHFSDDDSAAAEFGSLEERADAVVVSCATPVPSGLKRKFSLGFAVFDYTEESVSGIGGTIKAMAAVCDKVLALPSRVDLGFPQLASWRERAQAALADSPAPQTEFAQFELPLVTARAGLFDLPGMLSDGELEEFVASIVQEVSATCTLGSSPEFTQAESLPSLRGTAGEEVRFIAPPPLSRLPETEILPEKAKPELEEEEEETEKTEAVDEHEDPTEETSDSAEEDAPEEEAQAEIGETEAVDEHKDPVEETPDSAEEDASEEEAQAETEETEAADTAAPESDASKQARSKIVFPDVRPPETEIKPPSISNIEDSLIAGPFPFPELEAWAGFNPVALKEKHEKALAETGFIFDGKGPIDLFARMNRSLRGWSVSKQGKLWREMLVYFLWLADAARKGSHRVEANIRERIDSVFKSVDQSQLSSNESLRIVRVLNLVGLLEGSLASDSIQEHQNAEKVVVEIIELTPDSETAKSKRLLQLRRLTQGLALNLPSLQAPEVEAVKKSFEDERNKLPSKVLRMIPGMEDVPAEDGEEDEFAPIDIRINLPADGKPAKKRTEEDSPALPALASRFPLDRLQEWAGFDLSESIKQYEGMFKREGFVLPEQGRSAVDAYATFNLQYRRWSNAHRLANWAGTSLYCLALAELARARGESVEGNIRERTEEIFALANDNSANSEAVRIIRVVNLVGSICSGLEAGAAASLKKAEKALMLLINATADKTASESEILLQLRRVGLGLGLHLPLMRSKTEEEARAVFEKERDLLPDELRRLLPADDISEKVREIREKVEELV